MTINNELLESLLADYKNPEERIGEHELSKQLTKKLVERALKKKLKDRFGEEPVDISGGCYGAFPPQLILRRHARWSGFDDKIRMLYARGMTIRQIQSRLTEICGFNVSSTLISIVTDAVIDDARAWQARPLDFLYPVVYFDCIHVKVQDNDMVTNKIVYLALGVKLNGEKELLGIWIARTEGIKFWLPIITEFKNRGVQDIFIACVDGLKGFPEAIEAVFPKTTVQLCIMHLVRRSLSYVNWRLRKTVAVDLRTIYVATTVTEAEERLEAFDEKWGKDYPAIVRLWRCNWKHVIPYFDYPSEIRYIIYTTNAIESVNRSLRKISKKRGSFSSDEALLKLFYLALMNISEKWTRPL